MNAFEPPRPKVHAPAPHTPRDPAAVRPIPAQHELYVVQRHALDVLHDIRDLEHRLGKDADKVHREMQRLERDAENTYRVIRSWLEEHTNGDS